MHRTRITVFFGAIAVAFFAAEAWLFSLQILGGDSYRDYADRQRVALVPSTVARARVVSSDGAVLAEDRLAFDVAVVIGRLDSSSQGPIRRPLRRLFYVPRRETLRRVNAAGFEIRRERAEARTARHVLTAWSELEVEAVDSGNRPTLDIVTRRKDVVLPAHLIRSADRLARMTGEAGPALLEKVIAAAMDVARLRTPVFAPVVIIKDVDHEVVAAVETRPEQFRGFQVRTRFERTWPEGVIAPHLVGYTSRFNPADVNRAVAEHPGWPGRGFFMTLRAGRAGVEKALDGILHGEIGMECVERDYMNRRQRVLADAPAIPGRDAVLTIDSRLQRIVEQALGDRAGAAVFLDCRTGHVLAIASSPTYDPACFRDRAAYARVREHPDKPLFGRAICSGVRGGGFPPGSIFKIVTALAALEKKCVPASAHCTGSIRFGRRTFHCHRRYGHGTVELTDAIKYSCNVFFYRTGQRAGDQALIGMARRLGFGRKTGVCVPGESCGNLPYVAPGGELLNLAIGQGKLVATPLQVARMVATVANDGVLMPVKVVRELRPFGTAGPAGEALPDDRKPVKLGLSKRSLDAVKMGLYKVVNEVGGTGHKPFRGFSRPFKVCGKTSTAQRRARRGREVVEDNVGWFVGFAPHRNPRIAFAIAVEHLGPGEGGGSTAAPIARQVLDAMPLDLLGIEPATQGPTQ